MKKALFVLCALVCCALACKKPDGPTMRNAIIQKGKWQLYFYQIRNVDIYSRRDSMNLLLRLPSCKQDDYYIFNMDNSLTIEEGGSKCATGDPQSSIKGSWNFQDADIRLTLKVDTTSKTSDILLMNDSVFVLVDTASLGNVFSTITRRFKHFDY